VPIRLLEGDKDNPPKSCGGVIQYIKDGLEERYYYYYYYYFYYYYYYPIHTFTMIL